MDKVSQSYWDESYQEYQYGIASDPVTTWLSKQMPAEKGTAFEAGCYPGRYLAWIGRKGWIINGMDLTPRMETDFREWLSNNDIKFNLIARGDVLEYMRTTNDRYDLVCSFGFVEHFENFDEVIRLHARIVKPSGTLIITVPHFRGAVQRFLHSWLDRQNLSRHHLPSMNPAKWEVSLKELGYTIDWKGYFGNFDFWADREKRNLFQKIVLKMVQVVTPLIRWLPNSRLYSPYCGIIARNSQ